MNAIQPHIFKRLRTAIHRHIATPLDKLGTTFHAHPVFGGVVIIITYFLLDSVLMDRYDTAPDSMIYLGIGYAIVFLLISYIRPMIYAKNQNKRFVYGITLSCSLLLFGIVLSYDTVIATILPTLHDGYLKPQVISLCFIAPILEELAYRYLLYDKWAKKKWGTWIGAGVIGIIFVMAHPIMGAGGFVLYWLPTILFYVTYNTTGLYGSIVAHILFNIVALL